jgi:hypothetical protein
MQRTFPVVLSVAVLFAVAHRGFVQQSLAASVARVTLSETPDRQISAVVYAVGEQEVYLITVLHDVVFDHWVSPSNRLNVTFHGMEGVLDGVFEAHVPNDDWIDPINDLVVLVVDAADLRNKIRPVRMGDPSHIDTHLGVTTVGHTVENLWLTDYGSIETAGATITFRKSLTDIGFSGGPLFEQRRRTLVGIVDRVSIDYPRLAYAKSISVVNGFLSQVFTLGQPGSFKVESRPSGRIVLSWRNTVGSPAEVVVERMLDEADGYFKEIASVPAGEEKYSDEDVLPGERYLYRIYARDNSTRSPYSSEVAADTSIVGLGRWRVPLAFEASLSERDEETSLFWTLGLSPSWEYRRLLPFSFAVGASGGLSKARIREQDILIFYYGPELTVAFGPGQKASFQLAGSAGWFQGLLPGETQVIKNVYRSARLGLELEVSSRLALQMSWAIRSYVDLYQVLATSGGLTLLFR